MLSTKNKYLKYKAKYLALKKQIGGVLTNDQRFFLGNELNNYINILAQLNDDQPPPLPALTPSYNEEELGQQLNARNDEFIEGQIYGSAGTIASHKVFGIRRNNRNYIIFTNTNVDTIRSIQEYHDL